MAASPTPLESFRPPQASGGLRPAPPPAALHVSRRTPPWLVRRRTIQAVLVLLTAATTFAAGAVGWEPRILGVEIGRAHV